MRIGINTLFLVPGDVGGTEVYLRKTLSAMAEVVKDDTLVLFTNWENDALLREELAGYPFVEFYRLPCPAAIRPLRILVEQLWLPVAVIRKSVDVLWSPGYTAPAICNVPHAVTIHDLQYKSHPEDMTLSEKVVLDVLVRTACRYCEAIITISDFSKTEILRFDFANKEKVYALPLGVDTGFSVMLPGDETEKVSKLAGMGIEKPYLLCVAHTYPHKNIDKLVEAFGIFSEQNSHQLVLVGKARRGEASLLDSLKTIANSRKVIRLNSLSESDLKLLYQCADIFVLPSSYEGFGLPVLEAMMAGVPVVTSRMASLPELGGEWVEYVDTPSSQNLLSAISNVMALSKEQRAKRVARARERAKGFSWEKTGEMTFHVLHNITEK